MYVSSNSYGFTRNLSTYPPTSTSASDFLLDFSYFIHTCFGVKRQYKVDARPSNWYDGMSLFLDVFRKQQFWKTNTFIIIRWIINNSAIEILVNTRRVGSSPKNYFVWAMIEPLFLCPFFFYVVLVYPVEIVSGHSSWVLLSTCWVVLLQRDKICLRKKKTLIPKKQLAKEKADVVCCSLYLFLLLVFYSANVLNKDQAYIIMCCYPGALPWATQLMVHNNKTGFLFGRPKDSNRVNWVLAFRYSPSGSLAQQLPCDIY